MDFKKYGFLFVLSVVLISGCSKNKVATELPESKIDPQAIPNPTIAFVRPSLTPVPMNTWKSYSDSEYGLSFKYPADLIVKRDNTLENNSIWMTNEEKVLKEDFPSRGFIGVSIRRTPLPKGKELKSWLVEDSYYENMGRRSSFATELQPYRHKDLQGFSVVQQVESSHFIIFLQKDSYVYSFTLLGLDTGSSFEDNPEALNIFLNMIDSVNFTK